MSSAQQPISPAVQTLITVLKETIPHMNERYKGMVRLQPWGKATDTTGPHVEGVALDIFLHFDDGYDKSIADQLIPVLLRQQATMGWDYMIYFDRHWDAQGNESRPKDEKKIEDHRSHIHIQWTKPQSAQTGFQQALTDDIKANVVDLGY